MTLLDELVFLAKTSYRVIRQPKINRGKSEVEHEYSDGWNQYWDHLRNARTLDEWLRIPGVEPETRYFNVDGKLRFSAFDSTGYYRAALLDALTENYPSAASVTEFGSGLGRNILYLKSRLPDLKAHGYELCMPGVEIANEAARKFGVDCQYSQLDYVRDPEEAYVFPVTDVAYTMFSLEQIPTQNRTAVEHIRDHCLLGTIHIEPVPENYPFTFRGLLGKLDHWKVDYLSGFDRNVRALKFADVSIKRLSSSHNPLMFPSVYVLRKAALDSNRKNASPANIGKMAFNILDVALRSSNSVRLVRNRLLFPGLRMAASVSQKIEGRMLYGSGCSIGQGSIVIVPPSATLQFGDEVYVGRNVELGPQDSVTVGDQSSIQDRSLLIGKVSIGRYCTLSLNVLITSGRHYYDLAPHLLIRDQDSHALSDRALFEKHHRPVRVEEDCWLGVNSVIMPGVTVGKGCVVGANAVVTQDLPPYVVAVGSPARIIKSRLQFSPPKSIDWENEKDLPYFYSGIGVSARERAGSKTGEGLPGDTEFSIALNPSGAASICMIARSFTHENCIVKYLDQARELTGGYGEIRFSIPATGVSRFEFRVQSKERWPILIKKVWVE